MNKFFVNIIILFSFTALSTFAFAQPTYVDSSFNRNGEVYLSVSGFENIALNGIYRLNNPQGDISHNFSLLPQYLFYESLIQNFSVDVNRNIYTLSDPLESPIGSDLMLKRQVLDNTELLAPCGSWRHDSRTGTPTRGNLNGVSFSNVNNDVSDWGCHAFIHEDHRTAEKNRWGLNTNVYRTITDSARSTRDIRRKGGGSWGGAKAVRPEATTPPSSPVDYLPSGFANQDLILPHYQGKQWYLVPNGAWYSSWKARWCCGTPGYIGGGWVHNSDGANKSAAAIGVQFFYQVFADLAEGIQYDWRLLMWTPRDTQFSLYNRPSPNSGTFATTYKMTITRASLAGCLDGCGFNSNTGVVNENDMIFDSAFMTYASAAGQPAVRSYAYSRTEDTSNYSLSVSDNFSSYITHGDPVGVNGQSDTKWIGLSVAPGGRDYLYYMGNSVIQDWLSAYYSNLDIKAVTVSNQWDQKGGIIFAFDNTTGNIIRFTLDSSGVVDDFETIDMADVLADIGADPATDIDDIGTDGFGNIFLAMTYPSKDPGFNVPQEMKWSYNDAENYKYSVNPESGMGEGIFDFVASYRKAVWRVSAFGQPPKEEGNVEIARRKFTRPVLMPLSAWSQIDNMRPLPSNIDSIVTSNAIFEGDFEPEPIDWTSVDSKLAVINAPIPPPVYSIYDHKSFIDIIGYFDEDNVPFYTDYSTNQSQGYIGGNLALGEVAFYMVENYANPAGRGHDPRSNPDYDSDTRASGFVSTATNTRYIWKTWLLTNYKDELLEQPKLINETQGDSFNYSTVLYAVFPGRYLITCKALYDWFNYEELTILDSIDDISKVFYRDVVAIPSALGWSGLGSDPGHDLTADALLSALQKIVTDEQIASSTALGGYTSRSQIRDDIFSSYTDTHANNWAVEGVIAEGEPPEIPEPEETVRVQRCNPSSSLSSETSWNPTSSSLPSEGYHGIAQGYKYYWRVDVASQALFYDELSETQGGSRASAHYQALADRLKDPNDDYYVNASPTRRFRGTGDDNDLRWSGPVITTAYLEYLIPGDSATHRYYLPTDALPQITSSAGTFNYIAIPEGILPPTDPYVATLSIDMMRILEYDVYVYDKKGNLRQPHPFRIPMPIRLVGQTRVMVVDVDSPHIVYEATNENVTGNKYQLSGNTGENLSAGANSNPTDISFKIKDNNPWEGVSGIQSHQHYSQSNIQHNLQRKNGINSETSVQNFKPVFNTNNRYLIMTYSMPSIDNTTKRISLTSENSLGWGRALAGFADPLITAFVDVDNNSFYSDFDFVQPVAKLGNSGSALFIPANYANNTSGYQPYAFYLKACDSSGNIMEAKPLNLRLHVRDNIPPTSLAVIREQKGNTVARIPLLSTSTANNTDDWVVEYYNKMNFASFIDRATSWNSTNDHLSSGIIAQSQDGSARLSALPQYSEAIVALYSNFAQGYLNAVPPGNIFIEDNVVVELSACATDNAGIASISMKYSYFDIDKALQQKTVSAQTWNMPGVSLTESLTLNFVKAKAVFREGASVDFPMLIPLVFEATDNALDWDTCRGYTIDANGLLQWQPLKKGIDKNNKRIFKTVLPVYGTELGIRTIDRGLTPKQ